MSAICREFNPDHAPTGDRVPLVSCPHLRSSFVFMLGG
jgi:hypothetical protein